MSGYVEIKYTSLDYSEDEEEQEEEIKEKWENIECDLRSKEYKIDDKHHILFAREFDTLTELNDSINCISTYDGMWNLNVSSSESIFSKNYNLKFIIPDIQEISKNIDRRKTNINNLSLPNHFDDFEELSDFEFNLENHYVTDEEIRKRRRRKYFIDIQKLTDEEKSERLNAANNSIANKQEKILEIKANNQKEEEELSAKNFKTSPPIDKIRVFLPGDIKTNIEHPENFSIKERKNIGTVDWLITYKNDDDKDNDIWEFTGQLIFEANSKLSKIDAKYVITTTITIIGLIFGTGLIQYLKRRESS